jgi:DNA-binding beta-propeller fold protein YncE
LLRTFPFNSPGKIAVDPAGNLWIVQTTTNTIFHYSSAGNQLSGAISDAGVPTALAIDNQGRLMVVTADRASIRCSLQHARG